MRFLKFCQKCQIIIATFYLKIQEIYGNTLSLFQIREEQLFRRFIWQIYKLKLYDFRSVSAMREPINIAESGNN